MANRRKAGRVSAEPVLASRFRRLLAQIVDQLTMLVASLPLFFLLGPGPMVEAALRGEEPDAVVRVGSSMVTLALFIIVHGYFLNDSGQTIGKKLLGIQITDLDGEVPEFFGLLLKRYVFIWLIALLPIIGPLVAFVGILLIFRSDRRCLHDLVAGTQVLEAR